MLTMTIRHVAETIHRSGTTVRRLNSAGLLPEPMKLNGRLLWRRSDVVLWIDLGMPSRDEFNRIKLDEVDS